MSGVGILLEEMTSVLEASTAISVDITVRTVIFSEPILGGWEVLLSLGFAARDDIDCVPKSVVLERSAVGVETVLSSLKEEKMNGVVSVCVSVAAGTEDWYSSAEVMVPTLVTAIFPEGWSPSVAVVASEITRVSAELLLKSEGELVPGLRLLLNGPAVPSVPAASGEVTGTETSLACDVGKAREGDAVAREGPWEEGDVTSWSEEGLVHDSSSEPMSMLVVPSERAKPCVPAE